MFQTPRCLKDS